jgi:transaldolase
MKFFVDTADLNAIRPLAASGLIDGVTTNPSLIVKAGGDFITTIKEICAAIDGPVSAEVVATDTAGMLAEGRKLAALAANVVVKLPLTMDGLAACRVLSAEGIKTNVTLCFSPAQGLLAAKAGATYVSPFIGRLDDIGQDGMDLIESLRTIFDNYSFATEVLAASIRSPMHVINCALAGADVATIPPEVFPRLAAHPLTEAGLATFLSDWAKSGQSV